MNLPVRQLEKVGKWPCFEDGQPATLMAALARNAMHNSRQVAVRERDFGIWQEITWQRFYEDVLAAAAALDQLGLVAGQAMTTIGDNRYRLYVASVAATALGAFPAPVFPDVPPEELIHYTRYGTPTVAIAEDQEQVDKLLELVPTPFASRTEAKDFFENQYPEKISFYPQPQVVSRFFLSNIEQKPDGTHDWRFAKKAILESMREGRNEDRWDQFRNLKMPVLVVRGEYSQDLPEAVYERMLQVLPSAKGVVVPDAGHWVHFDQPEAFIRIVKEFLTCTYDSVY